MSFNKFHVKTATKDTDLVALAALVNSAYRGETSKLGWTSECDLVGGQRVDPESLLDIINAENSLVIILESKETGSLIGCCHIEKSKENSHAYLGMVSVSPTLQNQGIGKALLIIAEKYSKRWGCDALEIYVINVRKELIDFYKRHGFVPTGGTAPFPYGDERVGLPKLDNLVFDIFTKPI